MTRKTELKNLEKQLSDYINYLPIIQEESKHFHIWSKDNPLALLLDEIQDLRFRILKISRMKYTELHENIKFEVVEFESELNNE